MKTGAVADRPIARRTVAKRARRARAGAAESPSAKVKPIAAVERALQVLNAFRSNPQQTLSELSKRTGLFKSTLLRILSTLERSGYIVRLGDGQYRVGGVVYELGACYITSLELGDIIRPALAELSATTGESASFYVRSGKQRQCVFRVDSPQALRHVINAGQIVDLDDAATSQLLRRYEKDGRRPKASVDYASLCIATSGKGDAQTASVAAPLFNTEGFIGVINVSGPVSRFTPQSVTRMRTQLAVLTAKISRGLGGLE